MAENGRAIIIGPGTDGEVFYTIYCHLCGANMGQSITRMSLLGQTPSETCRECLREARIIAAIDKALASVPSPTTR